MLDPAFPLDELACRDPARFLADFCGLRWLPSYGGAAGADTISVRDRYQLSLPTEKRLSLTGLRALLQLRENVTFRLLEAAAVETEDYCRELRSRLSREAGLAPAAHGAFIASARRIEFRIPGSTAPTSDIDIATDGDCSEYFVRRFNSRFRAEHQDLDSGTVFDVNVYASNFLPDFSSVNAKLIRDESYIKDKAGAKLYVRPQFNYTFHDYAAEQADANSQLIHALAKLRQHMGSADYQRFSRVVPFPQLTAQGEVRYQQNQALLERYLAQESPPQNGASSADRARLMSAQNRIYETLLSEVVEVARGRFDVMRASGTSSPQALDGAFAELRDAMSASLSFANEAYVSGGGILHVVGGKQITSRGVNNRGRVRFHNLAYTAHELIQSAIEQLADIYKSGAIHLRGDASLGAALLASGKYSHRLINAVKHFYAIVSCALAIENHHPVCCRSFAEWDTCRKLGFGLESIKKLSDNDELSGLLESKFSIRDSVERANIIGQYSQTHDKASLCLQLAARPQFAITSAFAAGSQVISLGDPGCFYDYFATLVACALHDYGAYMRVPERLLQQRFGRDTPPYYLPEAR